MDIVPLLMGVTQFDKLFLRCKSKSLSFVSTVSMLFI